MIASWRRNRLTSTLGIEYPIIQGPLGGLSSQKLTAAVSNVGGLGSLGGHSLAPDAIKDAIARIRSLTSNPFAINLWVSMEDDGARTSDEAAFTRSLALLRHHLAALGAPPPVYTPYVPMRFENQARVLLDAHVPVFSFIYGIPPREILDECRNQHIVTIGTATTPDAHTLARPADRRPGRRTSYRGWRHRRCPWLRGSHGAGRRGRPDGNSIPHVRGIRRQPTSSGSITTQRCGAHRPDKRFHGKTGARSRQRLAATVQPDWH